MGTRTGYIGVTNGCYGWWCTDWAVGIASSAPSSYTGDDGSEYRSPNTGCLTMYSYEYPSKIQLTNYNGDGFYSAWDDYDGQNPATATLYLCTNNKGNSCSFASLSISRGYSSKPTTNYSVSGSSLKGKALWLRCVGNRGIWLRGQCKATITTVYNTYTITWKSDTGGTYKTTTVTHGGTPSYGGTPSKSADAYYTYSFSRWNPTPSAASSNATYTAVFSSTKRSYAVTTAVSPSGAGTVTAPASGSSYTWGTTVSLSQTPAANYTFSGWTVTAGSVANNQLTMPASAVTVTANYVKTQYTITTAVSPSSGGTITAPTNNTSVAWGTEVSVDQTPADSDTDFLGWTLSNGDIVTNNKFTMPTQNVTLTALYRLPRTVAYHNGTEYKQCIPYYYDGTDWVKTEPYYYDGTDWIECSNTE